MLTDAKDVHSSIPRNGKNHADDVREIAKTIGGQVIRNEILVQDKEKTVRICKNKRILHYNGMY